MTEQTGIQNTLNLKLVWQQVNRKKKVKRQILQRHGYIQNLFFGCPMIYYNNVIIDNEMI